MAELRNRGACTICSTEAGLRRGRCGACSAYFYRTGRERTPDVTKERHGHSPATKVSKEYLAWCAMKSRCFNPKTINYRDYGGRGITVCPAWRQSFTAFLNDVGLAPSPEFSIDRIDHDGDYEPGNVRWARRFVQDRNTRRNRLLTHNGLTLCITDWASRLGIKREALNSRLLNGWPVEKALATPVRETAARG